MINIAQSDHFETEHLLARRTTGGDRDGLLPVLRNPGLLDGFRRASAPDPLAFVDEAIRAWDEGRRFTFTLLEKVSNQTIGFVVMYIRVEAGTGLWGEPVIALDPAFYDRGYAYEAALGLATWAFESIKYPNGRPMLSEVRAACLPSNSRALNLLSILAEVVGANVVEREIPSLDPQDSAAGEEPHITARVLTVTRENYNTYKGSQGDASATGD